MRLTLALAAAVAVHLLVAPSRPASVSIPSPVHLLRRVLQRRELARATEEWPDFLAIVRSRIGSGEPLPDAVRAAARSMGRSFGDLDRAWGGSFVAELDAARERWSDPVADRVFTTLRIAATTGGAHVDAVLSALSVSLSDEMRIRAAHDAALTQQRMTAGVALVSPWVILVLGVTTNPQASAAFSSPTGRLVLVVGAVATLGGYLLARRAARLSAPPRVFA